MDEKLKLTRRKFLQVSAAAGAVAAAGGIELAAHAAPDEEAKTLDFHTEEMPTLVGGFAFELKMLPHLIFFTSL